MNVAVRLAQLSVIGLVATVVQACSSPSARPVEAPPRAFAQLRAPAVVQKPPSLRVASLQELSALDLSPRLGESAVRDAAWVPGSPLLVNRDFDMAMALSFDIGPGVAVVKRRKANAELARRLDDVEPIDAEARLHALCAKRSDRCATLLGVTLRIYALLFGERAARLRVVLERASGEASELCASVSEARPLQEFEDAAVLVKAFEAELGRALDLLRIDGGAALEAAGRCGAGDSSYVAGQVIARDAERVVLRDSEVPSSLVSCGIDAFREQPPPSGGPGEAPL